MLTIYMAWNKVSWGNDFCETFCELLLFDDMQNCMWTEQDDTMDFNVYLMKIILHLPSLELALVELGCSCCSSCKFAMG